jgi:DNA-binding MarR family transcriptional regulator
MPSPRRSSVAAARARALAALRVLVAALSQSARAVERHTGITNAQLFLLQQLAEHGPQSVGELAARAQTQASTASIVVSRLVAHGLVNKSRAADDARRTSLSLTPAARRLVRAAPTPPTAQLLSAVERLSVREARALVLGLEAMRREMHLPEVEPALLFEDTAARRRGAR